MIPVEDRLCGACTQQEEMAIKRLDEESHRILPKPTRGNIGVDSYKAYIRKFRASASALDLMYLYIWEGEGVLTDYTDGMILAIAPDLETAHKIIQADTCGSYPDTPTRIIDLTKNTSPEAWLCWGGG